MWRGGSERLNLRGSAGTGGRRHGGRVAKEFQFAGIDAADGGNARVVVVIGEGNLGLAGVALQSGNIIGAEFEPEALAHFAHAVGQALEADEVVGA